MSVASLAASFRPRLSGGAVAVALMLAAGVPLASAPALAADKKAATAAPQYSPAFQKLALPLQAAIANTKTKPETMDATKAQLVEAFGVATTPDDKYLIGQWAAMIGQASKDTALMRRGIDTAVTSGKATPETLAQYLPIGAQLAMNDKDYATARKYSSDLLASGYKDNGDVQLQLALAYLYDNQVPQGLEVLKKAIDTRNATGTPAPDAWYRQGLQSASESKQPDLTNQWALLEVQAYPTPQSWGLAISLLKESTKFQPAEELDLLRLMDRSKSWYQARDYVDYVEFADARRQPGEVVRIIDLGLASGKLTTAGNPGLAETRSAAQGRIAEDKAALAGADKAVSAPTANATVVTGYADAFLGYGQADKAESLYTLALTKPGADTARLQTRIGIAQFDQGKYADAQATFAKVEGARKPIAKLWSVYAAQKAKGG